MSQDPREYLPFLRELRALDQHYQRFRIDDHLRRYEKALTNLSLAGKHLLGLSLLSRADTFRPGAVRRGDGLRGEAPAVRSRALNMARHGQVRGEILLSTAL